VEVEVVLALAGNLQVLGALSHSLHRRHKRVADSGLVRTHEDDQSEGLLVQLRDRLRLHAFEID
jgi:hypothetical protein